MTSGTHLGTDMYMMDLHKSAGMLRLFSRMGGRAGSARPRADSGSIPDVVTSTLASRAAASGQSAEKGISLFRRLRDIRQATEAAKKVPITRYEGLGVGKLMNQVSDGVRAISRGAQNLATAGPLRSAGKDFARRSRNWGSASKWRSGANVRDMFWLPKSPHRTLTLGDSLKTLPSLFFKGVRNPLTRVAVPSYYGHEIYNQIKPFVEPVIQAANTVPREVRDLVVRQFSDTLKTRFPGETLTTFKEVYEFYQANKHRRDVEAVIGPIIQSAQTAARSSGESMGHALGLRGRFNFKPRHLDWLISPAVASSRRTQAPTRAINSATEFMKGTDIDHVDDIIVREIQNTTATLRSRGIPVPDELRRLDESGESDPEEALRSLTLRDLVDRVGDFYTKNPSANSVHVGGAVAGLGKELISPGQFGSGYSVAASLGVPSATALFDPEWHDESVRELLGEDRLRGSHEGPYGYIPKSPSRSNSYMLPSRDPRSLVLGIAGHESGHRDTIDFLNRERVADPYMKTRFIGSSLSNAYQSLDATGYDTNDRAYGRRGLALGSAVANTPTVIEETAASAVGAKNTWQAGNRAAGGNLTPAQRTALGIESSRSFGGLPSYYEQAYAPAIQEFGTQSPEK